MATREEVKPLVCLVLSSTSELFGIPHTRQQLQNNENLSIRQHLGLTVAVMRQLSRPYTSISHDRFGGAKVTQSQALAADTVKKAIDLVLLKSNS